MESWIETEYKGLELGDQRLNTRCKLIISSRSGSPGSSILKASMGDRSVMKATYRFLDNNGVDPVLLMEPHFASTIERCAGLDYVIILHDTTNINLSGSPLDLGHIDNGTTNGIMAHSAMAISPAGQTQGLLYQRVWGRDRTLHGQSNKSSSRAYEDKESYKWEQGVKGCIEKLGITRAIHVCDRESDIYEFMSMDRPSHHSLVVRSRHARITLEGSNVRERLIQQPEAGRYTVSVVRGENRLPEPVEFILVYCTVEIKPPGKKRRQPLSMNVVMAQEVEIGGMPGKTVKKKGGIEWILYTDLPVESADRAREIVLIYTRRWLIERFHYVLKSGCGVEKLQLRQSFEQIHRALALFNVIAWRLMYLSYIARTDAEIPAGEFLEQEEWEAIWWWKHNTFDIPTTPPSIGETVRWIAMLGGYLGRNNDGPPGMKTLWQGYILLTEKVRDWKKFKEYLSTYKPS